jgi:hypothetical protein
MARDSTTWFLKCACEGQAVLSPKLRFDDLRGHSIPPGGGVYVLFGAKAFQYPGGRSPVFYIGQSTGLRGRLVAHLRHTTEARQQRQRERPLYWPRYEYAAVFGRWYSYATPPARWTPRKLEEEVMAIFAGRYRSFPVANGAGSWNRVANHIGYPRTDDDE